MKLYLSTDPDIKVVALVNPDHVNSVKTVLDHPTWNGVVIIDEAYVGFTADAPWVTGYPNLVVMQIFSKAGGCLSRGSICKLRLHSF